MLSYTIKIDQEEVTSPTFNSSFELESDQASVPSDVEEVTSPTFNSSFELESDQASVPSDVEEATQKQRDYAKTDFNASRKVPFLESSSDE